MNYRLMLLLLFSSAAIAQKATVNGTVYDKEVRATLPFANITLDGTGGGITTDENGNYALTVDAGTHTLEFSFVGYEPVSATVDLQPGQNLILNQHLGSGSQVIEDVVVKQTVNRERENALLIEQKNAVRITQSIGAQEMSRKGASDAESAVTKVTGVSKQQGEKNVFV